MSQRELAFRRIDHQILCHKKGIKILSKSELKRLRNDLARYRAELAAERAEMSARQAQMSSWWQRSERAGG